MLSLRQNKLVFRLGRSDFLIICVDQSHQSSLQRQVPRPGKVKKRKTLNIADE